MLRRLGAVFLIVALTLIGLEGAVRLVPSAAPLNLLQHFESGLRVSIADRLGLPNRLKVRYFERDDGGPPLRTYLPFTELDDAALNPETDVTVRMDEEGFCNPVLAEGRPPRYDVVAIGDSFTWCTSVAETATWPLQLGRRSQLAVYNLGMPNLGLFEYVQLLKGYGLGKCPSVVVMAVYEGNDLRDAVEYERHSLGAGSSPGREASWIRRLADPLRTGALARHSYVFNLLVAGAIELSEGGPADTPAHSALREIDKQAVNFRYAVLFGEARRPFNVDNSDRDEVVHAEVLRKDAIKLSVFEAALAAFEGLAQKYEFTPVVVYIPSAYTAYAPFVQFEDARLGALMSGYSATLRAYFADAASRFGLRYADATPAMQAAAGDLQNTQLLYFSTNVHLTPAGHRVVADTVSGLLETVVGADPASMMQAATAANGDVRPLHIPPPRRAECLRS